MLARYHRCSKPQPWVRVLALVSLLSAVAASTTAAAGRAALAALLLQADLKPVESPDPQIECLSLESPCPQTNPVRGYCARPKQAKSRGCPAILFVRAAGVSGDWCRASVKKATSLARQYGAIVVDINAHGMLNGQPREGAWIGEISTIQDDFIRKHIVN